MEEDCEALTNHYVGWPPRGSDNATYYLAINYGIQFHRCTISPTQRKKVWFD